MNKYRHLVQKPQLCFPTVISMVALRRGIWIDQEEIAKKLDIKITKDVAEAFNHKFKITKKPLEAGYDVQHINIKKLNSVLKKFKLPIKAEFVKLSQVENVDKFIKDNLKENNDIAMLFLWKAFGYKADYAHYVLISNYDTKNKAVTVCDPSSQKVKSLWKANIIKFLAGMTDKWDKRERGFLIFK